jgi:autotransporter-associated beta strand protein
VRGCKEPSQLILAPSGNFDLNGFDHRKNGLSGTGTVTNSDSTLNTLFVSPGEGLTSQFDGVLTGNLNLALDGAGRLDLGGSSPNTYAGVTFIIRGTLVLEKPAGVIAIPDSAQTTQDPDLGIGDGNGPNASAVLNQANPDQIEDGVDVVVNKDGQFISGRNERLDQFTINGQLASKIQLLEVDEFSVTSSSALIGFDLAGTTPVVSHSQIRSSGGVSLDGKLNLTLIGGFIPAFGDSFKLIDKTSAGAVTGTFVGLTEGATFVVDGLRFQITYVGGDGNDVVVTRVFGPDLYVTAPEKFFDPVVRVFDAVTGEEAYSFLPYLTGYTKGVRVATADVNDDDFPDIICAPGKQDAAFGANVIRVFNGKDGTPLPGALGTGFNPFPGFDGGLFVAAGDFNQDGRADIAVSKNLNTDPTIKVISGANGTTELASLTDVFPNSGTFLKGVRIAVGDVTGDFVPDLIATAGKGSQATVRALDGVNFQPVPGTLGNGFNPFADHAAVNRVLFIAAGDVDGDGKADIITSFKINSNLVRVFDENGVQLKELQGHPDPAYTGGMRVGVTDANNDGKADLVIGTGAAVGLDPAVRLVDFATLADIDAFFAYDQENMGVFVGGTVS